MMPRNHPDKKYEPEVGGPKRKTGSIFRLSISHQKGTKKTNVPSVTVTMRGIDGDAHAGSVRAISLLPYESFGKLAAGDMDLHPGDFGENITTVGMNFGNIGVGTRLALGDDVVLEIVQVGKECHDGCIIRDTTGDCIMPREGLFARVIKGGMLTEGDMIRSIE